MIEVSIHAPARGATRQTNSCNAIDRRQFRSTLPHGERPNASPSASGASIACFDPRSRTGSDHRRCALCSTLLGGFNPRSRTGSDTSGDIASALRECCFDPRSRTGSDSASQALAGFCASFDPRSRTGSDGQQRLSIHEFVGFNPRSRTGSDYCRSLTNAGRWQFQSTLPHGERRAGLGERRYAPSSFNPRSRTGSDHSRFITAETFVSVSIHAPARGATFDNAR